MTATPTEHAAIIRKIANELPDTNPRKHIMLMAARLREVVGHTSGDAALDLMAQECLRQMEWARSECLDCIGGAAEDSDERVRKLQLTPAPEDWKPWNPTA